MDDEEEEEEEDEEEGGGFEGRYMGRDGSRWNVGSCFDLGMRTVLRKSNGERGTAPVGFGPSESTRVRKLRRASVVRKRSRDVQSGLRMEETKSAIVSSESKERWERKGGRDKEGRRGMESHVC